MAMIAARAGVAAGTPYLYFENKDVLINELYREVEKKISAFVLKGYSTDKSIRERFLHIGTNILRYFILFPLDFRYLEQFHNSPYGVAHRRDKILGQTGEHDPYMELFEQGIAQQVFKDIPLVMLLSVAFGPLLAVARDHILGFIQLDEHLIEMAGVACWDALKK